MLLNLNDKTLMDYVRSRNWSGVETSKLSMIPVQTRDIIMSMVFRLFCSSQIIWFAFINAISPHLTYGKDRNSLHINIHFLNFTESNGLNCYIGKLLCLHIQLKLCLSSEKMSKHQQCNDNNDFFKK